ncbi:HLH-domain-containing protein [Serendipita vermifera]|nr:HLH-domain-containing protein [Serendipita vermifera]
MSYLFTSSSYPKVRQEGFHTQQQQQQQSGVGTHGSGLGNTTGSGTGTPSQQSIPAPNAFDPNSIYTTGALFADAYRATQADPFARRYEQNQQQQQQQQNQQQQQSSSLDIHEELGFMHPPNSATSESFQQQRPHDIFGVNQPPHYPSLSLPHTRALYSRDEFSSTTPASLHNSYGRSDYFPNNPSNNSTNANDGSRNPNELTPQQIQQQQQFGLMSSSLANSAAAAAAAASLDNFNPGGEQVASSGVTRSRSRSRSKVSASRSRVSKRPSLPAPPHEEGGESPDSSRAQSTSRPSAIVIPGHSGHPGHHGSHSFSSFHTSTTHPASPVTWGYPGHVNPNGDYGEGSAGHQLFGQSFGGAGSLGPGQSPTAHNSGSPPPSATMDAATKLALANEKRRKRRESHNAVERRRRDNINEKIQELALLLPEEWLETGNPTGGSAAKNGSVSGGSFGQGPSLAGLLSGTVSGSALAGDDDSKEIKANKGVILRNSVEYIKNLVQLVQVQRSRNDQLESELAQYRNRFGSITGSSNAGSGNMGISNSGISPGNGMQTTSHADDDANAMAGYVLHSMNSPEGFDVKSIFGSSVGPLETMGSSNLQGHNNSLGHGPSLSSGNMSMEGVETSPSNQMGMAQDGQMGMMGMTGMHGMHPSASNHGNANNGGLGVNPSLMDTTSPSTGSGEGDEVEEDEPRGRKTTRFPAGVGKHEDEVPTL